MTTDDEIKVGDTVWPVTNFMLVTCGPYQVIATHVISTFDYPVGGLELR